VESLVPTNNLTPATPPATAPRLMTTPPVVPTRTAAAHPVTTTHPVVVTHPAVIARPVVPPIRPRTVLPEPPHNQSFGERVHTTLHNAKAKLTGKQ